jgi:hypothetical protein
MTVRFDGIEPGDPGSTVDDARTEVGPKLDEPVPRFARRYRVSVRGALLGRLQRRGGYAVAFLLVLLLLTQAAPATGSSSGGFRPAAPTPTGAERCAVRSACPLHPGRQLARPSLGSVGSNPNLTEWEFDGYAGPWGIVDSPIVYDSQDRVLLTVTANSSVDTWTYNGTWENITAPAAPSCASPTDLFLAYDTEDGYALLYAGGFNGARVVCTWEYTHGGWVDLDLPMSEEPFFVSEMAYDAGNDRFITVGGNSTWAFSSGNWSNLTAGSEQPPAAVSSGLVYDGADNYTLWFGGSNPSSGAGETATWELSGDSWRNISSESPSAPPANLYYFNNTTSTPASPFDTQIADDPPDGYVLLLHEEVRGFPVTAWTFSGGVWHNISYRLPLIPPYGPGTMAYDPALGAVFLWSPDVGLWEYLNFLPLQAGALTILPDPVDVGSVTTIRMAVLDGLPSFEYNYSGLPPGCRPYDGPYFYCTPTATGSTRVGVVVTDAVGEKVDASLTLVVDPPLQLAGVTAFPDRVDANQTVVITSISEGGTPPYAYAYEGLPAGCRTGNASPVQCAPAIAGNFRVKVSESDAAGATVFEFVDLTVLPSPRVYAGSLLPDNLTLGANFTLTVSVDGGAVPYHYRYSGLPGGCPESDSDSWDCTPRTVGTFHIEVNVTDELGESSYLNATLTVTAPSAAHEGTGAPFWTYAAGGGALLAAVGLIVLLRRRHRRNVPLYEAVVSVGPPPRSPP